MTGPSTPTTPGTHSRGLVSKYGKIVSVDGNIAYVQTSLTETLPVRRDIMRAKGRLPDVGETWALVREQGYWTFGLIIVGGDKSNLVPMDDVVGLNDELYDINLQQTINIGNIATHTSQITALQNARLNTGVTSSSELATGSTTVASYTPTLSGGVPCVVIFTAPPSGKVVILNNVQASNSSGVQTSLCSWELRTGSVIGSGVSILAPSDDYALRCTGTDPFQGGDSFVQDGLTPGSTYHLRQQFRGSGGTTASFSRKRLIVIPSPA